MTPYICEHCGTIYFQSGVCDWDGKELVPYNLGPRPGTGAADYDEIERNEFLHKDAA